MQQLILGTGTATWWLTEPHYKSQQQGILSEEEGSLKFKKRKM